MGKHFIRAETFRVTFPDGEWCDIKQEFTQADVDYIANKMMGANVSANGKMETNVSVNFGKQATLERAIIAWSFVEDDKPVPVTSENISNLRTRYRIQLLAEIERLTTEATAPLKN